MAGGLVVLLVWFGCLLDWLVVCLLRCVLFVYWLQSVGNSNMCFHCLTVAQVNSAAPVGSGRVRAAQQNRWKAQMRRDALVTVFGRTSPCLAAFQGRLQLWN